MKQLNILEFPLQGSHLIEASAGTGKTYTIASLYLRMLLEAGRSVDSILVVTFTNAATEELRLRIRDKIVSAIRFLQGRDQNDALLAQICARVDQPEQALQTLQDSLTRMDEACIFTIHGFCQRMLHEHAFESGSLFEMELLQNEQEYRQRAVESFWRRHFYQADAGLLSELERASLRSPADLLPRLAQILERPSLQILPEVEHDNLQEWYVDCRRVYGQAQVLWQSQHEAFCELMQTHEGLNRRSYSKAHLPKWLNYLGDYFNAQAGFDAGILARFSEEGIAEKSNDKGPPSHPLFAVISQLLQQQQGFDAVLLRSLMKEAGADIRNKKYAQNQLSFHDLLQGLHEALAGDLGPVLAAQILQRFPVAMIDEFQDTDPLQYDIFHRIYAGVEQGSLLLIGDPKQAIYSFRGADIHTYLKARHDHSQQGLYSLDTNWRSATGMVATVNQLFEPDGAFMYGEDIPFTSVQASPEAGNMALQQGGKAQANLCWHLLDSDEAPPLNKEQALWQSARRCARHIAHQLNQAQQQILVVNNGRESRPLEAGDIAVLVRSHHQARQMKEMLQDYGIASVYQGDKSVYDTTEAAELLVVLLAIAEPTREPLLRSALLSRMMGVSLNGLLDSVADERRWAEHVDAFTNWQTRWQEQGFMPMFMAMLQERDIAPRLLDGDEGERRMTNLLHLAELIQQESVHHFGMESLLRWFTDSVNGVNRDYSEGQQLRLESDEHLVQILTIHKSKGLEYPVVYLPFAWQGMREEKGDYVFYHPRSQQYCLATRVAREQYKKDSHHNTLAEDMRLLYVALTRAKYQCHVCWGQVKDAQQSALGHLLQQHNEYAEATQVAKGQGLGKKMDQASVSQLQQGLAALCARQTEAMQIISQSEIPERRFDAKLTTADELQVRSMNKAVYKQWTVASFTRLTSRMETVRHELPEHDGLAQSDEEALVELLEEKQQVTPSIFSFPRGAQAGECLHAIFENIDFTCSDETAFHAVIQQQLERYGFDVDWLGVVVQMLQRVLACKLDVERELSLSVIDPEQRLVEMEFAFPIERLNTRELDSLIQRHGAEQREEMPALEYQQLSGLMKGFVDLIFCHQGRFYIVDYKSNHLGNSPADYAREVMHEAILHHRYNLQYQLYTLALHRYLKLRMADYDYEQHFGGVYYLFLRGMHPQHPGCGVYADRPSRDLIESLDDFFSRGEH